MQKDISFLNNPGIYEIFNKKNNKRYIGQSIHIRIRLLRHKNYLNKNEHINKHLQAAWNKYGEEYFEFNVLEYCNIEELDSKEDFYIKKYKSNNPKYGYNYRIDNKTNRGLKWSEEQREKMFEKINDPNGWFKNHSIPEETLKKAWEANKNRIWTEEERKRHSEILKGTKVSDTSNMKKAQQGSKNPSSKLSEDEVKEIILLCKNRYRDHKRIAEVYNVCLGSINSISSNRTWKHINRNDIDNIFYEKGIKRIDDYEKRLDYAKLNTSLPDNPDYNKINEFVMDVNERVVRGDF